jgi:hypothetical protein
MPDLDMASVAHLGAGALSGSASVLSLRESTGLQSSLPLLQKNYKFSKVFFWGKITGTAGEYLIAMGIEESFAQKTFFFWCALALACSQLGCGRPSHSHACHEWRRATLRRDATLPPRAPVPGRGGQMASGASHAGRLHA